MKEKIAHRTFAAGVAAAMTAMTAMAAVILLTPALASAAQAVRMMFREKPPYSYTENGVQKGFLLEYTNKITKQAGVAATFEVLPTKRIFAELEANTEAICTFGWYKTPDRERYAQFTAPIVTDRPHIVLASSASAKTIKKHKTLKSLFADPQRTMTIVEGTSYGTALDTMLGTSKTTMDRTTGSPIQAALKVAAQRVEFMLIDQDDFEHLLATEPSFRTAKLVKITFPDMPAGLKRYLLCSQQVPQDVIKRFNAAIASRGPARKSIGSKQP